MNATLHPGSEPCEYAIALLQSVNLDDQLYDGSSTSTDARSGSVSAYLRQPPSHWFRLTPAPKRRHLNANQAPSRTNFESFVGSGR